MKPLRVAVVGCSPVGQGHAGFLAELPDVRIVAVADPNVEAARALAAAHGVERVHASHADLLAAGGIDAAVLAVPTFLHEPVAAAFLRAGVHVFLEKPPARSMDEVRSIRAAARAGDARVMIGYQRRHDPRHIEAARRIATGELGRVYYARATWINSRLNPKQGRHCHQWSTRGAAMASLGSHYLDFTWHLIGAPKPLRAVAWAHRDFCAAIAPEDPGDDLMTGMVWLEGDRMIRIEAARQLQQPNEAHAEVFGERGSYSDRGAFLRIAPDGTSEETVLPLDGEREWPIQAKSQMQHFVARCRGADVPGMEIDQAVALQAMIEALYASAGSAGTVVDVAGMLQAT